MIIYKALTKDDEVESIEHIRIERDEPARHKEVLTIQGLNTRIATVNARIDELKAKRDRLIQLEVKVREEAAKVKLKEEPKI